MKILQITFLTILTIRIGGILLKKINVNNENQWLANFFFNIVSVSGFIMYTYHNQGTISFILSVLSLLYTAIYGFLNKENNKIIKFAYVILSLIFIVINTITFLQTIER